MYGEGDVTDRKRQKWFAKFHAGDFFLDNAPGLVRPVKVDSYQNWDINWEQSKLYHTGDSQHTQNIQINKMFGEYKKCVFYSTEKTKLTFWPTH